VLFSDETLQFIAQETGKQIPFEGIRERLKAGGAERGLTALWIVKGRKSERVNEWTVNRGR
jgi:hypothetical protein